MSGYIGAIPVPEATQNRTNHTATAGQTTFAVDYTVGFIDVFLNGIKLANEDFTATNGSSVVLASAAAVNDIFDTISYTAFNPADTVSASTGGTFAGGVTVSGTLTANSAAINANGSGGTTGIHVNKNDTNGYFFRAEFDGGTNNNRTYNLKPPISDSSSEPFIWATGNSHAWEVDGSEVLRIGSSKAIGLSGANYGTAGQVLTSAGSGAAPSWASPAVGFAHTLNSGNPAVNSNPAAVGHMWVNTTTGESFICTNATANANVWVSLGVGASANIEPFSATGGIKTTYGLYTVHSFLSSGNFQVTVGSNKLIDYLIVAGGAGGGVANGGGGGGGAGGLLTGQVTKSNATYSVVVGAGGAGGAITGNGLKGVAGGNSSVFGLTAIGGGYGGGNDVNTGGNGGSGGGGARIDYSAGGSGTAGQGHNGAGTDNDNTGAGGGGAGAVGGGTSTGNAGNGGVGLSNSLRTGSGVFYAGGGGGGIEATNQHGTGGNGGGGDGGDYDEAPVAGTANTGGGGGGSGDNNTPSPNGHAGGAGGSGIVIIRYLT